MYLKSIDSPQNIYIGSDKVGIFKDKEQRVTSYSVYNLGENEVFTNTTTGGLSFIFQSTVIDESNINSFSSYNGFKRTKTPDLRSNRLSVWFYYEGKFKSTYFYY